MGPTSLYCLEEQRTLLLIWGLPSPWFSFEATVQYPSLWHLFEQTELWLVQRRFQIQKQRESVLQGFKRKEHNTLHYPSPWFLWRSWCPVAQRSFQHLPSCSNEPSTNPRNPRSDGQPSNQRKSIGEQEGSFIIQLYKQIVMPVLASGLSESNMSRIFFHQMCCILTFQNYIPY